MLTFLAFISSIQGCSSMRHGVARRGQSFSRLLHVSVRQIIEVEKHTSIQ
jgi:hypothetical protein